MEFNFLLKECLAQAGVSVELTKHEIDTLSDHFNCANFFAEHGALMFGCGGTGQIEAAESFSKCLQPLADIVRSRDRFFSSEGTIFARRHFWLQVLRGLPRVRIIESCPVLGAGDCCEDDLVMFVVEQSLLCDVSASWLHKDAGCGRETRPHANLDCSSPQDFGMSAKRACVQHGYCEGFLARSSELTNPPSNAQPDFDQSTKMRHHREAEELELNCERDASRLQALQQNLRNAWKVGLDFWFSSFKKHQYQLFQKHCDRRVSDLQSEHVSRRMALKEKHLRGLFAPMVLVTNSQLSVLNGCYELKVDSLTEAIPVYQHWGQHRWLYKATSQQWCISDLEDKDQRLPNGWAHSSAAMETSSPIQAAEWRVMQGEEWQPSGLAITVLPDSGMELVVASVAGVELLRKAFKPSTTVAEVKREIEIERPKRRIRLSLHGRILADRREVGCIGLGPGEVIQAVLQATGKSHPLRGM